MENQTNQLTVNPLTEIGVKLNECVLSVIGKEKLQGFERAFLMAEAMGKLKELLTPEYMAPIMLLQGSRLGFKTDKDTKGGYEMSVVKHCLIEAVLMGLEVTGNQFNIISGNTYATKEGCGALLAKFTGLKYSIVPTLPRIDTAKGSAAVIMKIEWTLNGDTHTKEIDIPIRVNAGMGSDAVMGKATRKARYWLYSHITGTEIGEGEVEDGTATVMQSTPIPAAEENQAEAQDRINGIKEAQRLSKISSLKSKIEGADGDQKIALQNELEELEAQQ